MKELKGACTSDSGIPAEEMRLIFKGKILKDENTLAEYKIEDGVTVHLVKGKSATGASTTTTTTTESTSSTGTSSS